MFGLYSKKNSSKENIIPDEIEWSSICSSWRIITLQCDLISNEQEVKFRKFANLRMAVSISKERGNGDKFTPQDLLDSCEISWKLKQKELDITKEIISEVGQAWMEMVEIDDKCNKSMRELSTKIAFRYADIYIDLGELNSAFTFLDELNLREMYIEYFKENPRY
jgi:hypothetical protein